MKGKQERGMDSIFREVHWKGLHYSRDLNEGEAKSHAEIRGKNIPGRWNFKNKSLGQEHTY